MTDNKCHWCYRTKNLTYLPKVDVYICKKHEDTDDSKMINIALGIGVIFIPLIMILSFL